MKTSRRQWFLMIAGMFGLRPKLQPRISLAALEKYSVKVPWWKSNPNAKPLPYEDDPETEPSPLRHLHFYWEPKKFYQLNSETLSWDKMDLEKKDAEQG